MFFIVSYCKKKKIIGWQQHEIYFDRVHNNWKSYCSCHFTVRMRTSYSFLYYPQGNIILNYLQNASIPMAFEGKVKENQMYRCYLRYLLLCLMALKIATNIRIWTFCLEISFWLSPSFQQKSLDSPTMSKKLGIIITWR